MYTELASPGDDELSRGWTLILGSILGIGVGVISLPAAAVAFFMPALQAEFGWSRTTLSLASTIVTCAIVATSPIVGWLADRISALAIISFSLSALAAGFLALSTLGADVRFYLAGFGIMAVLASGSSVVPYARLISANFVRRRGAALGMAMTGNGLAGVLLPLFLVPHTALQGWRSGFVLLAGLVLVVVPLVVVLLWRSRAPARASVSANDTGGGMEFLQAIRTRTFVLLMSCFGLVMLGVMGLQIHFVSFLTDSGYSASTIGLFASIGGATAIVSRILTGWLADRYFAPRVAASMIAAASLLMAALAWRGGEWALLGTLAGGLAIGSEIDMIGYLTARYFGMRAYGRIYSLLYSACLAGSSLSILAYGLAVDISGTYDQAIIVGSVLLAVSALMLLTLPPYLSIEYRPVFADECDRPDAQRTLA